VASEKIHKNRLMVIGKRDKQGSSPQPLTHSFPQPPGESHAARNGAECGIIQGDLGRLGGSARAESVQNGSMLHARGFTQQA